MLKKRLIITLFFFLLACFVKAEELTVKTEEDFSFEGVTFTVHSENPLTEYPPARILFLFDSNVAIVEEGDCEDEEGFTLCYVNAENGTRDTNTHRYVFDVDIEITKIMPELTINRTFSKTELLVGELSTINVIIENTGKQADIEFIDSFPDSVGFTTNFEGCTILGKKIEYQGELKTGEKHELTYQIRALKSAEFEQKAQLSYIEDNNKTTIYSDEEEIVISEYALDFNYPKLEVNLGEEFFFNFSLANLNKDKDLEVTKFNLNIPENIKIIKKPFELGREENKITFYGEITKEYSKNFSLKLKPRTADDCEIDYDYRYNIDGLTRTGQGTISIIIIKPTPEIRFNKNSFVPGKNILKIDLSNPTEKDMKDIQISLSSNLDIEIETKTYSFLMSGKEINLVTKEINIPDEEIGYPISITITYDVYGQTLTEQVTKTLNVVVPATQPIENLTDETTAEKEPVQEEQPAPEKPLQSPKPEFDEAIIKKLSIFIFIFFLVIFIVKKNLRKNQ